MRHQQQREGPAHARRLSEEPRHGRQREQQDWHPPQYTELPIEPQPCQPVETLPQRKVAAHQLQGILACVQHIHRVGRQPAVSRQVEPGVAQARDRCAQEERPAQTGRHTRQGNEPGYRTHQQVLASQPCQTVEREQQQQRAAPTQARLHQDKRRKDEAEGGRHLRIDLRAVDKEGSAEPQQPCRDNGCAEVPGDAIGKEHHARRGQAADKSQEPLSRIDAA